MQIWRLGTNSSRHPVLRRLLFLEYGEKIVYIGWVKAVIVIMFCCGINCSWARGPSIEDVPEQIDANGRPFLFFRSKGKILMRECDPKGISPSEDSCKALSGSFDVEVGEKEFVNILKSLVLLEEGDHTPEMKGYSNIIGSSRIMEFGRP